MNFLNDLLEDDPSLDFKIYFDNIVGRMIFYIDDLNILYNLSNKLLISMANNLDLITVDYIDSYRNSISRLTDIILNNFKMVYTRDYTPLFIRDSILNNIRSIHYILGMSRVNF